MAVQLQLRRGTTAENEGFTGALAEVSVDTDTHELRVHDGSTQGGFVIPTKAETQEKAKCVVSGEHNYISAGADVADNLVALDTQLKSTNDTVGNKADQATTLAGYGITDGADTDLDNLSNTGKAIENWMADSSKNIGNWSSNITNCIVEIPQDIKMELNNGTLTLKAGSRIYLKGDTTTPSVIIENDLTTTQTTDTQYFAIYDGSTFTTVTTTAYNYGSLPNTYSYPLALITVSGGQISSIDQMFNGFSYIGKTVLCFPNVKYIIPNGRDVNNNMLNQTKTTTFISSVSYNSYNTGKRCLVLDNSGSLISYSNTYYRYDSNDILTDSFVNTVAEIGTCVVDSGNIQSINIIQPFQIVGYDNPGVVVKEMLPTSSNNHTWYRKYANGWVEQGGRVQLNGTISATNKRVTFPVEMATSKYVARADNNANVAAVAYVGWESTTGMSVGLASGSSTGETSWEVKGMASS